MVLQKHRRRSVDSSSSSSESSGSRGKHKKREAKKKEKAERKQEKKDRKLGYSADIQHNPSAHHQMTQGQQSHFVSGVGGYPPHSQPHDYHGNPPHAGNPPPYAPQNPLPPSSGYRVPLTAQTTFPLDPRHTGPPAFIDADGVSPIFIGSAIMEKSVHPCKLGPHLNPFASVPYGGGEYGHHGRFDLLPFRHDQMEWVRTSNGRIPSGRRPIEGGYEGGGHKLYHAVAVVNGIKVPGKTGEHLGSARVPFGGVEHQIYDDYEILCWRY